jgi:RNA-directed DNA polymerase
MSITKQTEDFLNCTSREDLAGVLGVPLNVLTYLAYSGQNKYTEFGISKKDGSIRTIHAPIPGLKKVQNKLKVFFEDLYNPPRCVYGFIKDRDAVKNAQQHLRKRLVLNFDLKNFFPSINAGRILGLFQAKPFEFNKEVASTLTGIVCYQNLLPQGSPVSPVLSNLIAFTMDRQFVQLAKANRLTYTRYADDITFSSAASSFPEGYFEKLGKEYICGPKILSIIKANGFEVNPKKTRFFPKNKPHYVTGIKVNIKPNISWNLVRQVRAMLHAWEKFGPVAAEQHYNSKYNVGRDKDFPSVVSGKVEYIRHIRTDLDKTYRKIYNKFVDLEGKGRVKLPLSEVEDLFMKVKVVSALNMGTGFILRDRYLVTCAHTLEGKNVGNEVEYFNYNEFSGPSRHKGKILFMKSDWDIALISLSNIHQASTNISFEEGRLDLNFPHGTSIKAAGFPMYKSGNPPYIAPAMVSAWVTNRFGVKEIMVDRPLYSGMSGGIVLDEDSKLIGIISRGVEDVSRANASPGNIFIPLYYIDQVISEFEKTI